MIGVLLLIASVVILTIVMIKEQSLKERVLIVFGMIAFIASVELIAYNIGEEAHPEEMVIVKIREGNYSTLVSGRLIDDVVYIDGFNMDKFILEAHAKSLECSDYGEEWFVGYVDAFGNEYTDTASRNGGFIGFDRGVKDKNNKYIYKSSRYEYGISRSNSVIVSRIEYPDYDYNISYKALLEKYKTEYILHRLPTSIQIFTTNSCKLIYSKIYPDNRDIWYTDKVIHLDNTEALHMCFVKNSLEVYIKGNSNKQQMEELQNYYDVFSGSRYIDGSLLIMED